MSFMEFADGKEIIDKAKEFATKSHEGQTRKFNGEPYITHPKAVADLVQSYGGNYKQIAAAWLHDVVEDCGVKIEDLQKEFGDDIARLVQELTNREGLQDNEKTDYMIDKMKKMSPEALTIKLCDRLNNVSDFKTASPKFVKRYAPSTKDIISSIETSCSLDSIQNKIVNNIKNTIAPYENI